MVSIESNFIEISSHKGHETDETNFSLETLIRCLPILDFERVNGREKENDKKLISTKAIFSLLQN